VDAATTATTGDPDEGTAEDAATTAPAGGEPPTDAPPPPPPPPPPASASTTSAGSARGVTAAATATSRPSPPTATTATRVSPPNGTALRPAADDASLVEQALFEVKKVIVGQDRVIERLMVALLAGGHVLLEGVPGLAKTLTASTLATVAGGTFGRVQFTPDLLPADITGTRIYRPSTESFGVELGPVFVNFLLADEVNRAPAKVQSALLEVMAEGQVTIGGTSYPVPDPFLVMATQNPIESEGVYPLPEAQRDRFLMKLLVHLPTAGEELEIVRRMGVTPPTAGTVLQPGDLARLQRAAAEGTYVDTSVMEYAVNLVLATRDPSRCGRADLAPLLDHGASPRASLGLVAAGRALALMRRRSWVLPQDIFDVAPDVLRHRLVLSYEALAQGIDADRILAQLLGTVVAPLVSPTQDPSSRARSATP
jgi:MoxR-like ATPase